MNGAKPKKRYTKRTKTTKRSAKKSRKPRNVLGSGSVKTVSIRNYFPLRTKGRFQYEEDFAINTGALTLQAVTEYTYRLGSVYDPRFELGGGQPLNISTLLLLYSVYRVEKVYCKVQYYNPNKDGLLVGVRVRALGDANPTETLPIDALRENTDTIRIKPINDTGSQVSTFSFWVYPWQVLGVSKATYLADNVYSSASSTNPSNYVMLDPFVVCTNGTDGIIRCSVSIDYYTIFSDKDMTL